MSNTSSSFTGTTSITAGTLAWTGTGRIPSPVENARTTSPPGRRSNSTQAAPSTSVPRPPAPPRSPAAACSTWRRAPFSRATTTTQATSSCRSGREPRSWSTA
ncbi:MAG: hypothetical protein ACKO4Z_02890 [Planctomycetota bacterium]